MEKLSEKKGKYNFKEDLLTGEQGEEFITEFK